jgi:hypothetical protein
MSTNGKMTWIHWLVATLTFIIITAITTIATNVVANDIASRDRDTCIEKEARTERIALRKELLLEIKELNESNKQILIALGELKIDINNVKNK